MGKWHLKRLFFTSGIAMVLAVTLLILPSLAQAGKYRQPAYITNLYFSDKMAREGEFVRPLAVVKALRPRPSGTVGYVILDLLLVDPGVHHFKINILDNKAKKVTELAFEGVAMPKGGALPLFTAAGAVSGAFTPGVWFFKVYDQVDQGPWKALGTFAVTVIEEEGE
ncbi:MAG: hypothetical protein HQL52_19660 [Magnetococcales bacterium]|nr:hypothetical protein [Magnetococcales bacterium]